MTQTIVLETCEVPSEEELQEALKSFPQWLAEQGFVSEEPATCPASTPEEIAEAFATLPEILGIGSELQAPLTTPADAKPSCDAGLGCGG